MLEQSVFPALCVSEWDKDNGIVSLKNWGFFNFYFKKLASHLKCTVVPSVHGTSSQFLQQLNTESLVSATHLK